MGKIFCLIGKSCSGKDTLFKMLINDEKLNLKPIISYTTRPIRDNEKNGEEYYFISKDTLAKYRSKGKIIESREYNTIHGKWNYSTIDDGQINLENENYLIIVTLQAFTSLQNYFSYNDVIPIYVTLEDGIRLDRAIKREMNQKTPNYDELCRRFLADSKDFSEDKVKACGIDNKFLNYNIEECFTNIRIYVLNHIDVNEK